MLLRSSSVLHASRELAAPLALNAHAVLARRDRNRPVLLVHELRELAADGHHRVAHAFGAKKAHARRMDRVMVAGHFAGGEDDAAAIVAGCLLPIALRALVDLLDQHVTLTRHELRLRLLHRPVLS